MPGKRRRTTYFLYVLQLEARRWYVGKTTNPTTRLAEHINGTASEWTRVYPLPINGRKFHELKPLDACSPDDIGLEEDKRVKQLMREYGMAAVRGGTYSNVILHAAQVGALEAELRHAQNQCLRCGRSGHWYHQCFAATDTAGKTLRQPSVEQDSENSLDANSEENSDTEDEFAQTGACHRCGRPGHWANSCYARRHAFGYAI